MIIIILLNKCHAFLRDYNNATSLLYIISYVARFLRLNVSIINYSDAAVITLSIKILCPCKFQAKQRVQI
jgi:hypothetical protein